jgi:putative heme-binding domain-containing protein
MTPAIRTRCLLALFLSAGVAAAQNPLAGNPAAVTTGEKLYGQACQACHGGEARGDRGPALTTRDLSHGSADNEIFRNIRTGIAGSEMPAFPELTADQIWRLVTYIRSLSGASGRNETVPGDPQAGERLFYGKASCSSCHAVNGRGGIVGPDLSGAAGTPSQMLRAKIQDPNAQPGAGGRGGGPPVVAVKTDDGREIRGVRRLEDTYSLQVMDTAGKLHLLDKTHIKEERYEFKSLMPDDFGKRLSPGETQDVVAYLKTLNGRDPEKTALADIPDGLTYERMRNSAAEPQNWLTYWGDYQGRHYSSVKQINVSNAARLQARWAVQLMGQSTLEATPIVVDGIIARHRGRTGCEDRVADLAISARAEGGQSLPDQSF